ncbi:MAG: Verru_Chthon cassette protein A [Prosthecobacter sp.]|nr:Verru_Chthon cassette protein A [Prosthecobacter sp.]
MNMLDKIMQATFPGSSETVAAGGKFSTKLGVDNQRQLLVEMFDYIRTTNLYDSYQAPERGSWTTQRNDAWIEHYRTRDALEDSKFFKTYTPGFVKHPDNPNSKVEKSTNAFFDRCLPGHGQVTPAEWRVGGKSYRGFGRSISISEIGLHFICTADGQPDMYSWRMLEKDTVPRDPDVDPVRRFKIPDVGDFSDPETTDAMAWLESNPTGILSGGRTALKMDRTIQNQFVIKNEFPRGFDGEGAKIINAPAMNWGSGTGEIKERYYSNYPPLKVEKVIAPGMYGTTSGLIPPSDENYAKTFRYHPGYNWRNWNYTLKENTPLWPKEKRIQAMLHFEFFCPATGYPEINPEFTLVVDGGGLSNITIDTEEQGTSFTLPLFQTTKNIVIKSAVPLFAPDDTPEVGGFASFRKLANGRSLPARDRMPVDPPYDSNTTGDLHSGILNLDLVSSFFTVNRNKTMGFRSSSPITIKIYDSHDYLNREPIQTIEFELSEGAAPPPDLIVAGSFNGNFTSNNVLTNHPAIQAPHWWTFHRGGALGRIILTPEGGPTQTGQTVDVDKITNEAPENPEQFWTRGRLVEVGGGLPNTKGALANHGGLTALVSGQQRVPGARALIYGFEYTDNYRETTTLTYTELTSNPQKRIAYDPEQDYNRPLHYGTDVVRTMQPRSGDPRLIYAKKAVVPSDWTNHIFWDSKSVYLAHNFSSYTAGAEPGFDRTGEESPVPADANKFRVLPQRVTASAGFTPDAPHNDIAHRSAQRYFDFDDSDPGGRMGPFVNKPDEGNYAVGEIQPTGWPDPKRWRATYFRATHVNSKATASSKSFFTPNRMITSPVMMGSLPSALLGVGGTLENTNDTGAWRNLLFRPHVKYSDATAETQHPGAVSPPDHNLLDLFWMPVVEPYAISEALSTAGKVNMNYQILPFTHIRRATALHAVMKGEVFAALPDAEYTPAKSFKSEWGTVGNTAPVFRDESNDSRYWHRSIVIDRFPHASGTDTAWWQQAIGERVLGTLRQFEERFNFGAGPTGNTAGGALPTTHRGGLFRSPSQICEIHLIPSTVPVSGTGHNVVYDQIDTYEKRNTIMGTFWQTHCATGDNTRERPYSNLYARLTTRSNTFRVHVRTQTIRKATRSVDSDTFDPAKDQITAEFRGSFLLERYIDTRDATNPLPDYAAAGVDPFTRPPLESFYRFRVLESKRFAP